MLLHDGHLSHRKSGSTDFEHRHALAQAIVDTVREPLLVLDQDLRVVTASRSFYPTFRVRRQDTVGRLLCDLGEGQWDIAELRVLLERAVLRHAVMEAYEVEQEFPHLGHRIMLLNARKVFYEGNSPAALVLTMEDVTERRAAEREMQHLLRQKELRLEEMQHRIANSLQIINSVLRLKARTVPSEEVRRHLEDAGNRILAVAAVQQHLEASARGEAHEIGPYLSKLCETLRASVIGERGRVSLDVSAAGGAASSRRAVSIGLIVAEAVINAVKHAFPAGKRDGRIVVAYAADGGDWKLSISDNGVGSSESFAPTKAGLGTTIINALAEQLEARVDVLSDPRGTTVTVTHTAIPSVLPHAA